MSPLRPADLGGPFSLRRERLEPARLTLLRVLFLSLRHRKFARLLVVIWLRGFNKRLELDQPIESHASVATAHGRTNLLSLMSLRKIGMKAGLLHTPSDRFHVRKEPL